MLREGKGWWDVRSWQPFRRRRRVFTRHLVHVFPKCTYTARPYAAVSCTRHFLVNHKFKRWVDVCTCILNCLCLLIPLICIPMLNLGSEANDFKLERRSEFKVGMKSLPALSNTLLICYITKYLVLFLWSEQWFFFFFLLYPKSFTCPRDTISLAQWDASILVFQMREKYTGCLPQTWNNSSCSNGFCYEWF